MNTAVRRALQIVATLVLVAVAAVISVAYWFGRGDIRGAARASMKVDLRNLAVAESAYFRRAGTYTTALGALEANGFRGFAPSERIQLVVERADSTAWQARASDPHTSQTCIFGSAATAVVCR